MTDKSLEAIEIYPHILVYKNMFKDISKSYKVLTDSLVESEDKLFSPWTKWLIFGEYLNPIVPGFGMDLNFLSRFKNIETKTEIEKNQKNFVIEMVENFHLVTEDYIKRYNIDVDLSLTSIDENENSISTWHCTGGTISKYEISTKDDKVGMRYHSDYIKEKGEAPGYKFVITCTMYFNDNYEGGALDFIIGNTSVTYKPEAGDILVFPSGHPDYLTEEGNSYLHGVMPAYHNNKFLARTYWQKYQKGTDSWYEKEKKFGKDVWAGMQKDLEEEFRQKHLKNKVKDNLFFHARIKTK